MIETISFPSKDSSAKYVLIANRHEGNSIGFKADNGTI